MEGIMDRLTECVENEDSVLGFSIKKCEMLTCKDVCKKHFTDTCRVECPIKEAIDKLAIYEDLEEQGKLLKLPCKPHDKLYWISDQDEDAEFSYEPIEEVEVCNIDYNGYSLQLWFADKGAKEFPVLEVSSIGEELFYSREKAEAALKEL